MNDQELLNLLVNDNGFQGSIDNRECYVFIKETLRSVEEDGVFVDIAYLDESQRPVSARIDQITFFIDPIKNARARRLLIYEAVRLRFLAQNKQASQKCTPVKKSFHIKQFEYNIN